MQMAGFSLSLIQLEVVSYHQETLRLFQLQVNLLLWIIVMIESILSMIKACFSLNLTSLLLARFLLKGLPLIITLTHTLLLTIVQMKYISSIRAGFCRLSLIPILSVQVRRKELRTTQRLTASIVGSATWLSSDLSKMSDSPLIEVATKGRPRHP